VSEQVLAKPDGIQQSKGLRPLSPKQKAKKRELAVHTLKVLSDQGYASASLRDIAKQAGVSLGQLHYYFENKHDLVCYCILIYKHDFISELSRAIGEEADRIVAAEKFVTVIAHSIEADGMTHRLWYDIRGQQMFDSRFEFVVADIEGRLVSTFEQVCARFDINQFKAAEVYAMFDGMFRYALQRQLSGDKEALSEFRIASKRLLDRLMQPQP